MLDSTVKFEDVDETVLWDEWFDEICIHTADLQEELGYDTIWSISETGCAGLDHKIFKGENYLVHYRCIKEIISMDDVTYVGYTAVAKDGSIGELWKAAESCFQQAQAHNSDWHHFIEDFEMKDDGTLELITGS
jgi:hypothetical protein